MNSVWNWKVLTNQNVNAVLQSSESTIVPESAFHAAVIKYRLKNRENQNTSKPFQDSIIRDSESNSITEEEKEELCVVMSDKADTIASAEIIATSN